MYLSINARGVHNTKLGCHTRTIIVVLHYVQYTYAMRFLGSAFGKRNNDENISRPRVGMYYYLHVQLIDQHITIFFVDSSIIVYLPCTLARTVH